MILIAASVSLLDNSGILGHLKVGLHGLSLTLTVGPFFLVQSHVEESSTVFQLCGLYSGDSKECSCLC